MIGPGLSCCRSWSDNIVTGVGVLIPFMAMREPVMTISSPGAPAFAFRRCASWAPSDAGSTMWLGPESLLAPSDEDFAPASESEDPLALPRPPEPLETAIV